MNTYAVLKPIYHVSHIERPPAPAKPFEVFRVEWRRIGTVRAWTAKSALERARDLTPTPVLERTEALQ